MKSTVLQKDRHDLIKLAHSLSPEERLVAFYHHSQLLNQLSLAGKKQQHIDRPTNRPSISKQ